MTNQSNLSTRQMTWLVLLRVAIGWHFLYEGLIKVFNPSWTPFGYLMDSKGIFAALFHAMAADPSVLKAVATMNEWGLILIGAGLITGLFTRTVTWAGMILLAFYYLSHPPLIGLNYALPSEGSYFIIDKVIIEFLAMGVLAMFPTGKYIGLDRLLLSSSLKNK